MPIKASKLYRMNRWLKLTLLLAFVISSLTPLFRLQTSERSMIEEGIDYIHDKWSSDKWGIITDAADKVKSTLFNEDEPASITDGDYNWYLISHGMGYGINTIGATEKFFHDVNFRIYNKVTTLAVGILFLLIIQLLFLFVSKLRMYLPFISLCQLLLGIFMFGYSLDDETTVIYLPGLLVFIGIHLAVLYFLRIKEVN